MLRRKLRECIEAFGAYEVKEPMIAMVIHDWVEELMVTHYEGTRRDKKPLGECLDYVIVMPCGYYPGGFPKKPLLDIPTI